MAESEISVINHLIEIELQASTLAKEAQTEADARISKARAAADADFKAKHEAIVKKYHDLHEAEKQKIETEYKSRFTAYVDAVKNTEQDSGAFNECLRRLLTQQ